MKGTGTDDKAAQLIRATSARSLSVAGRHEIIQQLDVSVAARNAWIKHQVIHNDRIDILAEYVLGYVVAPKLHGRIIRHQLKHRQSLTLCYRGAGKTTSGTIAKAIHCVLKYPDVKILIASKTGINASDFLKEIKQHFESNERLIEIFGNYVGNSRWDNTAIEVRGRTRPWKEPTIMTLGLEGSVASKHYDVILADDLVDEENSRTPYQRQKMLDWYYKMLSPTLRPPDAKQPVSGQMHHLGTRFHYEDMWGHLMEGSPDGSGGQLRNAALIIPAIGANNEVPWPEKHTLEWFEEKRRNYGIIRFNSQYQCDTEAMKGQIFQIDKCRIVDIAKDAKLWPDDIPNYMGVDLAIGQDEQHDMFAIVVLGRDPRGIFVQDFFQGQLRFNEQTKKILEFAKRWKPARIALETNAYQAAQYQEVRRKRPDLNLLPVVTLKDKVSRAWQLAKHFDNGKVAFKPDQHALIEHLVLFPDGRLKDLFDAFDLAMTAAESRVRKARREPGVI